MAIYNTQPLAPIDQAQQQNQQLMADSLDLEKDIQKNPNTQYRQPSAVFTSENAVAKTRENITKLKKLAPNLF